MTERISAICQSWIFQHTELYEIYSGPDAYQYSDDCICALVATADWKIMLLQYNIWIRLWNVIFSI